MAEQNILTVSLKAYKDQIKQLQEQLLQLEKGTEEYDKVAQELVDKQTRLNDVLSVTKTGATIAANSMAELKAQLKEMKAEANNIDIGSPRFKELSEKILETTNKLKDLEAQQGTFSRNVGNYAEGVRQGLESFSGVLPGVSKGLNMVQTATTGLNSVFTTLSKHPIIAVFALIVGVLMKIKDAVESNEEAMKVWNQAMAGLQPIFDTINTAVGTLAEWLAQLFLWFSEKIPSAISIVSKSIGGLYDYLTFFYRSLGQIMSHIPGLEDSGKAIVDTIDNVKKKITEPFDTLSKKYKEAADNRKALDAATQAQLEKEREMIVSNAKYEEQQAKLRDKIALSSGKERLKLVEQLRTSVKSQYSEQLKYAKEELRLAREKAKLSPNSSADNKKLAELEANVTKVNAAMYQALTNVDRMTQKTNAAISKANDAAQKAFEKRMAELDKEISKRAEVAGKSIQSLSSFNQALIEIQKKSVEIGTVSADNATESVKNAFKDMNAEIKAYQSQINSAIDQAIAQAAGDDKTIEKLKETKAQFQELITTIELQAKDGLAQASEIIDTEFSDIISNIEQESKRLTTSMQVIGNAFDVSWNFDSFKKNLESVFGPDLDKMMATTGKSMEEWWQTLKNDAKNGTDEFGIEWDRLLGVINDKTIEAQTQEQERLTQMQSEFETWAAEYQAKANELRAQADIAQDEETRASLLAQAAAYEEHADTMLENVAEFNRQWTDLDKKNQELRLKNMQIGYKKEEQETQSHNKKMSKFAKDNANFQIKWSKMTSNEKIGFVANEAASVGKFVGQIADIWMMDIENRKANIDATDELAQQKDEILHDEFEKAKAMQIASVTIETLAGAVGAVASCLQSPGGIPGAIMGALLAASMTATGVASIMQIEKTRYESALSGATSLPEVPEVEVPSAEQVDPAKYGFDLNSVGMAPLLDAQRDAEDLEENARRVYILQQDITDSNDQVEIRESQTTF